MEDVDESIIAILQSEIMDIGQALWKLGFVVVVLMDALLWRDVGLCKCWNETTRSNRKKCWTDRPAGERRKAARRSLNVQNQLASVKSGLRIGLSAGFLTS